MTLPGGVRGLTLDAGALIGVERRSERVLALLAAARRRDWSILVPVGALAQVWRGGSRQTLLARLLLASPVAVVPLDEPTGRAAGILCGRAGRADVIDASVLLCARHHRHAVLTSDPDDLAALDPAVPLLVV